MYFRIDIQGEIGGEIFYDVALQSGKGSSDIKKFNDADIKQIYSTIDKLAEALRALPTA